MDLLPINIGDEEFKVVISNTPETRSKGLSGVKSIGRTKGMIFMFPTSVRMSMIMRDMAMDLDFVFLSDTWEIIKLGTREQYDLTPIYPDVPCRTVIELKEGSIERLGLAEGDKVTPMNQALELDSRQRTYKKGGEVIIEDIPESKYDIKVDDVPIIKGSSQLLNKDGEVIDNIKDGARIFSRDHTKEIIKKFKDNDKEKLALFIMDVLDIQDNQEQEFV